MAANRQHGRVCVPGDARLQADVHVRRASCVAASRAALRAHRARRRLKHRRVAPHTHTRACAHTCAADGSRMPSRGRGSCSSGATWSSRTAGITASTASTSRSTSTAHSFTIRASTVRAVVHADGLPGCGGGGRLNGACNCAGGSYLWLLPAAGRVSRELAAEILSALEKQGAPKKRSRRRRGW